MEKEFWEELRIAVEGVTNMDSIKSIGAFHKNLPSCKDVPTFKHIYNKNNDFIGIPEKIKKHNHIDIPQPRLIDPPPFAPDLRLLMIDVQKSFTFICGKAESHSVPEEPSFDSEIKDRISSMILDMRLSVQELDELIHGESTFTIGERRYRRLHGHTIESYINNLMNDSSWKCQMMLFIIINCATTNESERTWCRRHSGSDGGVSVEAICQDVVLERMKNLNFRIWDRSIKTVF